MIIKRGDFGRYRAFTLTEDDGSASDLTGLLLYWKVWIDKCDDDIKLEGLCETVGLPTAGICRYLIKNGDFPATGRYKAEIEGRDAGGNIVTSWDTFDLVVEQSG